MFPYNRIFMSYFKTLPKTHIFRNSEPTDERKTDRQTDTREDTHFKRMSELTSFSSRMNFVPKAFYQAFLVTLA